MQLISMNVPGNVHSAVKWCNEVGLAGKVLQIDYSGGNYSIVVLKVRDAEAPIIRRWDNVLPEYVENPEVRHKATRQMLRDLAKTRRNKTRTTGPAR